MAETFFQDFKRDDGSPVTVEYSAIDGEPYADLPGHICDGGGSGPDAEIITAWPNTEEYNDLHSRRQELTLDSYGRQLGPIGVSMMSPELREELDEIDKAIERFDEACRLTDAERKRMTDWIIERHVYEPYEPEIF